jgi:quercetin dioxygenase-like cupin family protein
MEEKYIKNIDFKKIFNFKDLIGYVEGGVESRTLVQREDFSLTLFAFDKGEGISAYSMPGDTMIYVYEGKAEVVIDEKIKSMVKAGETIVVTSNVLHSLDAVEKSKIMIIIVKTEK